MKYLINILGPGASGKSTLSRGLLHYGLGGTPDGETVLTESIATVPVTMKGVPGNENIKYVVSKNGVALAGNYKNGTDSIKAMDALPQVLRLCWNHVDTVIVDPVRSSMKFVDWLQAYPEPLTVLFTYLDISLATNTQRLLQRRYINASRKSIIAVPETVLPQKTYDNMLAFRERAAGVWHYAGSNYSRYPRLHLALPEYLSVDQSVKAVMCALDYLKNGGGVIKSS